MKKQYRVKKNQEIEEILANKKSAYNPYFSLSIYNNIILNHKKKNLRSFIYLLFKKSWTI